MSDKINNKVEKIILGAILLFSLLFLYQITIASNISFSNGIIDRLLHFCEVPVFIFVVILVLVYFFNKLKRLGQRIAIGLISLPVVFIFIVTILFSSGIVFASDEAMIRYYFFEKGDYSYYVISERFYAFEGSSELKIYKEKPILLFLQARYNVSEDELSYYNINVDTVYQHYYDISIYR